MNFLFVSSWANNGASALTDSSRPNTLTRSVTPSPTKTSILRNAIPLPHRLVKSASSSQIKDKAVAQREEKEPRRMAAAVAQPVSALRDEQIMDTRTSSPSPSEQSKHGSESASRSEDDAYKPDLSQEVSMLSTKLINAINHQTTLDDTLQHTRHELEGAQKDIKRIRAEKQSLDDAIAQGVLVKKSEVDKTISKLKAELAEEKAKRENAEKAKRQTDKELEDLTADLFDEANKMVAEARKDTEAVERRNSQLKGQLSDTEVLLASQQEQLQDLKLTMEKLERIDTNARDSSVPSTPINSATAVFDALYTSPNAVGNNTPDIPPDHPLHFSYLITPVLRTDVAAYTDFAELLSWARRASPHSRNTSGTGINNSASATNLSTLNSSTSAAATSSPNLPGAFSFSANNSPSSATFGNGISPIIPPLKESKFYKRTLLEDLEPTLRLDLAPGLSFLSRRTVTSALLHGTLAIEPFSPPTPGRFFHSSPIFACSLCGESRKAEPYARRHRFRVSDSEDAARYPLCEFCLNRVRASADFLGFLRMVREGFWRLEGEEAVEGCWEESVRLRERMFWARVGGGVVPVGGMVQAKREGVRGEGRTSLERVSEDRVKVGVDEQKADVEGREGNAEEGAESPVPSPQQESGSENVNSVGTLVANEQDQPPKRISMEVMERMNAEKRRTVLHTPEQPIAPILAPEEANAVAETESPRDQVAIHSHLQREVSVANEDTTEQPIAPTGAPGEAKAESETGSQQDQAEADLQLRREVSEADEVMQTPPETVEQERTEILAPIPQSPAVPSSILPEQASAAEPKAMQPPPIERTSRSASAASSQRNLSPARPQLEERRPSSVLARVRAMEARGGGK